MRIMTESSGDPRSPRPARVEEAGVRVLFVADPSPVRSEIRQCLEKTLHCRFELVLECDLERAVAGVQGGGFDVLLLDLGLAGLPRRALVDRAHEIVSRLPVVLLSGTESLRARLVVEGSGSAAAPASELLELEEVDLPGTLIQTLRRARRLGTAPVSPVFCRLERTVVG
jgi:CheY-like chemotaxis protein